MVYFLLEIYLCFNVNICRRENISCYPDALGNKCKKNIKHCPTFEPPHERLGATQFLCGKSTCTGSMIWQAIKVFTTLASKFVLRRSDRCKIML